MPIPNLKQILESDSQQERLDKINYNFDQLVANGGGPMGSTGPIGETGMQGVTGDQGPQGVGGDQGTQGPINTDVSNFWKDGAVYQTSGLNIQTIVPVDTIDAGNQKHSPTVLLGFTTDYPEYSDVQSSPLYKAQLVVNKNDQYVDSNIRLVSNNSQGIYADFDLTADTYFDGTYGNELSRYNLNIGFNETVGIQKNINYRADSFKFKDLNDNDLLTMDANNGALFTGNFVSTGSAHFVGSIFKIDVGVGNIANDPALGKIAVSLDSDGTIGFKSPEEIGAGIPIGTIISFLPSIYEDTNNFIQSQDISNDIANGTNPDNIEIEIGAGIAGTEYEGWYLCNGETWVGQNGESYTVPNLNSFNYSITTPDGNVNSGPVALNVLGGSYATMNQSGSTLTDTYVTGDEPVGMADSSNVPAGHIAYKIVRTPQLIYLGLPGFYFKVAGAPPATIRFMTAAKADILSGGPVDPEGGGVLGWQKPSVAPVNGQYEFAFSQTRMDRSMLSNHEALTKDLRYRIDRTHILDDSGSGSDFSTGTYSDLAFGDVDLSYGQDAVLTVQVKAKPYFPQPSGGMQSNEYDSLQHYSWFTNWNEYRLPSPNQPTSPNYTVPDPLFVTGTWNDKGEFDSNGAYYAGDVFQYNKNWYTLNPMLVQLTQMPSLGLRYFIDIFGNQTNITYAWNNPEEYLKTSHASWKGRTELHYPSDLFVKLPSSSEFNSYDYTSTLAYSPFDVHPNPLGDGMGLGKFEGCYDQYMTGVEPQSYGTPSDEWWDDETDTPIFPPGIGYSTGDSLISRKGIYTQPMQVAIDPVTNNGESAADQIVLPVVNTFNVSEIQSQYPGLGITSNDVVQYLDPYTYDEGADHWRAVHYDDGQARGQGGNTGTNPYGPFYYGFEYQQNSGGSMRKMALQGGWNTSIDSNGVTATAPLNVHAWRYNQEDTMFRRYRTVEFKVILDSSVVDQILNYNNANPNDNLKLLLGHYLYGVGDGQEQDFWNYNPGNIQPLGGNNKRSNQVEGDLVVGENG